LAGRKGRAAGRTGAALLLLLAVLVAFLRSVRKNITPHPNVGAGVPSWREVTDEELLR
jgi:hypothetical protein